MKMPENYPMICPSKKTLCQNGVGFLDPESGLPTSLNNQGFLEMLTEEIPNTCEGCRKLVREILNATNAGRNFEKWQEQKDAA